MLLPKLCAFGRQATTQGRAKVFVKDSVAAVLIGNSKFVDQNGCSISLKVFQVDQHLEWTSYVIEEASRQKK